MKNMNESHEHYGGVVVQFGPRWRVVLASDKSQWMLQYRGSLDPEKFAGAWSGKRFCVTSKALRRDVRELVPSPHPDGLAALDLLPDFSTRAPVPWEVTGAACGV